MAFGRLFGRGTRTSPSLPSPIDGDPIVSVLDLGTGTIKALVIDTAAAPVEVLACGAAGHPAAGAPVEGAALGQLVAAAEAALVSAEDAAGVVPRRVVVGVGSAQSLAAVGRAEAVRRTPAPVTLPELNDLKEKARQAALAAARRFQLGEWSAERPLDPVHEVLLATGLDDRSVGDPVGRHGGHLAVELAVVYTPSATARHLKDLTDALDLECAGIVAIPFALAVALGRKQGAPAIIVDVGAHVTSATIAGEHGLEGTATIPVGGASLEARLQERLGVSVEDARLSVEAHAAGAGHRGPAGLAARRVIAQVAQHHADVWLDALEVMCAELARDRSLPPRLLLCGGGASLPELRRVLASRAWQAQLPFERPPSVRVLGVADVPDLRLREEIPAGPALVPCLCLASTFAV
jgi:cell division protein FtsA